MPWYIIYFSINFYFLLILVSLITTKENIILFAKKVKNIRENLIMIPVRLESDILTKHTAYKETRMDKT